MEVQEIGRGGEGERARGGEQYALQWGEGPKQHGLQTGERGREVRARKGEGNRGGG